MEFKELNKYEIGERIKARRESINMSRDELGSRLSLTSNFIADIEYGTKGISVSTLYKLKQALGVSTDYILEGNVDNMPDEERRRVLNENILGSLSVCSEEQLMCMEKIARLYVEGIIAKE